MVHVVTIKLLANTAKEADGIIERVHDLLAPEAWSLIAATRHAPSAEEKREIRAAGYNPTTGDTIG